MRWRWAPGSPARRHGPRSTTNTYAFGVEGSQVVGTWYAATGASGPYGFSYSGGAFASEQFPGSIWTQAHDVNGAVHVGSYYDGTHVKGFRHDGGVGAGAGEGAGEGVVSGWQTVDYPGSTQTIVHGVSGTRVVGSYGPLGSGHGFVLDGADYTTLDYPGATDTRVRGVSGARMVGTYSVAGTFHAFVRDGTTWSTIARPGAEWTNALSVDGARVVGSYFQDDAFHGFLYDGATWLTLDYPGALHTEVYGIDGANVVGVYTEPSGAQHGFLAVVPEPAGAATLAVCAAANLLMGRRRGRRLRRHRQAGSRPE